MFKKINFKYLLLISNIIILSSCSFNETSSNSSNSFNVTSKNESSNNISSNDISSSSSEKESSLESNNTLSFNEEITSSSKDEITSSLLSASSSSSTLVINEDNIIDYIFYNLNTCDSFKLITSGNTKATGYNQKTNTNLYYTANQTFSEMNSSSSLVNHSHYALIKKDTIKYKDSDNKDIIETNYSTYKNEFGIIPTINNIFSFDVKKENILKSDLINNENGYILNLTLDNVKSSKDMGIQMKRFGVLKKEPTFKEIKLEINLDNNYKLLSFKSYCSYKITKQVIFDLNLDCTQELVSTFVYNPFDINEVIHF